MLDVWRENSEIKIYFLNNLYNRKKKFFLAEQIPDSVNNPKYKTAQPISNNRNTTI